MNTNALVRLTRRAQKEIEAALPGPLSTLEQQRIWRRSSEDHRSYL